MRRNVAAAAATVLAVGVGAVGGVAIWEAVDDDGGTQAVVAAQPSAARPTSSGDSFSVAEIYRRSSGAVVEVRASSSGDGGAPFEGPPFDVPRQATGSGFVIDEEGRVITNQHVIDGADQVRVVNAEGEEYDADVVGSDPSTDIALLDVQDDADLPVLELGSSESLSVGDPVVAIGSPFGLQGTVTAGIVSGLDREIQAPDGFAIDGAIQTDAALNSGNSGGPLLDVQGRVVGVNSQIESRTGGNVGIGYAVPIDTAKNVVAQLREDGTAEHGYLGVQLREPAGEDGVPVAEVVDDGPADKAGLRAGDRILRIGGNEVDSVADVRRAVGTRTPGDRLELEVRRNGDTRSLTVELGERPATAS
jgi:putative serine protease PepD